MAALSTAIKRMAPGVIALAAVLLCAQVFTQLAHATDHDEPVCTACVQAQTNAAGALPVPPSVVADFRLESRSAPVSHARLSGRPQRVAQQRAPPASR